MQTGNPILWLVAHWAIRFFAVLGALSALAVGAPLALWLMPKPAGSWSALDGDTLVVLGSGTNSEFPDLDTYWRCVYAVRIFRAGSFERVILSGGPASRGRQAVAEVMAAYLRAAGIPGDKILSETSSTSTRENALYVNQLLSRIPAERVVLLTSDYHTQRAEAAFHRVGLPVQTFIVPYVTKLGGDLALRPMLLKEALLERAKLLWYRYRGWT